MPQPSAPAAVTNAVEELRPLKPPVDIPSGWAWLGWVAACLLLAALAWGLWRWWQKRRLAPPAAAAPPLPPHVEARRRLEAAWQLLGDPERFTVAVSAALRWYLERRFHLPAPERTTEEFLQDLQRTLLLQPRHKELLADFLTECDLIKFARFEPTEEALRRLHAAALRLVDETSLVETVPAAEAPPAAPACRS
ncbi:MAG: hypothetical protein N3J91_06480 [Verrucomicrobiae bacterium]|nr:hypothetical protein [Verrucomicrobiae bacterium]